MSSLTTIISIIVNTICMESQIGILKNKHEIGLICIWYCNKFCDYNFKKIDLNKILLVMDLKKKRGGGGLKTYLIKSVVKWVFIYKIN